MILTEEDRKILEQFNYTCQLCDHKSAGDFERSRFLRVYDVPVEAQTEGESNGLRIAACLDCIDRVRNTALDGKAIDEGVTHLRSIVKAQVESERAAFQKTNGKRLRRPRGAGGASNDPTAPPTWALHLPDDELIKHLAYTAGEVADRKAARRETTTRGMFILIFGGFAWLGLDEFRGLRTEIGAVSQQVRTETRLELRDAEFAVKQELRDAEFAVDQKISEIVKTMPSVVQAELLGRVESAIAAQVSAKVDPVIHDLRDQIRRTLAIEHDYASLRWLLASLKEGTGFSDDHRKLAEALFDRIVSSKEMVERRDFLQITESLLDLFAAADLGHLVDKIDDVLQERATSTLGIAGTMIQHYGRLAIGSPYPLERIPELVVRFEKYARALRDLNYPEVALPFELLLEFRRSNLQTSQTIDGLVKTIPDLTPEERGVFFHTLDSLRDASAMAHVATAEIKKVVATANAFYEAYKTELDEYKKDAVDPDQARMRSILEGLQGGDDQVPPDSE